MIPSNLLKKAISFTFLTLFIAVAATWASKPLTSKETLMLKKNFYLLYLLRETKMPQSEVFTKIASSRNEKLQNALNCQSSSCLVAALQLSPEEIAQIGDELVKYASINEALVSNLQKSKMYINYDSGDPKKLIKMAWETSAQALNRIVGVYINGDKITYPKIDAGDFAPSDSIYLNRIKQMLKTTAPQKASALPYETLMLACLKILFMNGRDEALRYEPLEKGWNKDAVRQIAKTKWENYPYSLILVPGLGPEEAGLRLDPNGAKRCDSAAQRYFKKLAPFIVVSGGHVHPNKTPFNEAVEMKKYMVEKLGVPSNVILIEPHARHTTTNLRNTNRLVYRLKIPTQKKILIVTDASQTAYILGNMSKTSTRDLGYQPHLALKKLSATESEYLPNEMSWQVNPFDPLDPR